MVNKKKQYCRAYRQKKGDLYTANDAARKKAVRERRKYLEPRKYKVFKKKESRVLPLSGNTVIKKMSEQLQVSTATSTSETTLDKSSAFSTKHILS